MRTPPIAARMVRLADELHAEGRAATARHSYTEGAVLRRASNRIRRELGLPILTYEGERPWTVGPDPFLNTDDLDPDELTPW